MIALSVIFLGRPCDDEVKYAFVEPAHQCRGWGYFNGEPHLWCLFTHGTHHRHHKANRRTSYRADTHRSCASACDLGHVQVELVKVLKYLARMAHDGFANRGWHHSLSVAREQRRADQLFDFGQHAGCCGLRQRNLFCRRLQFAGQGNLHDQTQMGAFEATGKTHDLRYYTFDM